MLQRLTILSALLLLAGCSSLCNHYSSTLNGLNQKGQGCGQSYPSLNTNQCSQAMSSCSDNEKQTIDSVLTCLDALPNCTSATKSTFNSHLATCLAPTLNLSSACSSAIFGSLQTSNSQDGGP